MRADLPRAVTHEVRDRCLCLQLQRAARTVARRFDEALRPLDLTHGQFSLLVALNRPEPPRLGAVAELLAMDRTTLTAALKPLARRRLLEVVPDALDKRARRLVLTEPGRDLLVAAVPVWRAAHDALDRELADPELAALRAALAPEAGLATGVETA